jgi:hypothetical protein
MSVTDLGERREGLKAQLESVLADHIVARDFVDELTIAFRTRAQGIGPVVHMSDSYFLELIMGSLARTRYKMGLQQDLTVETLLCG